MGAMRVLIAGATGAVGTRLVPLLIAAGHEVIGITRTPGKAESLRRAGATPMVVDALRPALLRRAVLAAHAQVVVHEMTALSNVSDLRRFDNNFAATNRLRTQALDYLLAAARESGARRFIAQSFCGWPYAHTGGPVKSEDCPLDPDPPAELRHTLDAIRHLEVAVTAAYPEQGLVLRYGALYGPGTGMLDAGTARQFKHRFVPVIGEGNGWWSFIHVEDAARATAAAVERGAGGIYNIVDDDPAPVREWLPRLAQVLGAKAPIHVPRWLARILTGEHLVTMMTDNRAGWNGKARRELGWSPTHPSWREGFADAVAVASAQH
jgi:nucleoside-diphosphate-sugar epimerase